MKALMTRQQRKLAKRLHMAELIKARRRGVWSDGNRLFYHDEIEKRIKSFSDSLINDTATKRPQLSKSHNAVNSYRMLRRNPSIHGLPDAVPDMMKVRARKVYPGAMSGTSGSMEHFVIARRFARKLGTIGRHEMLLPDEERAMLNRFRKPCAFVNGKEIVIGTDSSFKMTIPPGSRFYGSGDGEWYMRDNAKASIDPRNIVKCNPKPMRLRKTEKRMLGLLPGAPAVAPEIRPEQDINDGPSPF